MALQADKYFGFDLEQRKTLIALLAEIQAALAALDARVEDLEP